MRAIRIGWPRARLAANGDLRGVGFVAFVADLLLGGREKRFVVCVFAQIAMAANYLFTGNNPNQPIRLGLIPRKFHTVCAHGFLQFLGERHCSPEPVRGEYPDLVGRIEPPMQFKVGKIR